MGPRPIRWLWRDKVLEVAVDALEAVGVGEQLRERWLARDARLPGCLPLSDENESRLYIAVGLSVSSFSPTSRMGMTIGGGADEDVLRRRAGRFEGRDDRLASEECPDME